MNLSNMTPGTYHIANNPHLFEPQRNNNFELHIMGLDTIATQDSTAIDSDTNVVHKANDIIRLSVLSDSVPSFSQNVIGIRYGNNEVKFAGVPTFSEKSLVINDYIGLKSKEAMLAWQKQSYDVRTQKVGLASDYKKVGYLFEYSPNYEVVRSWKIVGLWISDLTFSDNDFGSSDNKTINATLPYDYAYLETEN